MTALCSELYFAGIFLPLSGGILLWNGCGHGAGHSAACSCCFRNEFSGSGVNGDFLMQDSFASLLNSRKACRMADFNNNNKEKHSVHRGNNKKRICAWFGVGLSALASPSEGAVATRTVQQSAIKKVSKCILSKTLCM